MARARVEINRNGILEAISGAAKKLGRSPHRGELPRVAGISHSVVLKHFASLRDAVWAAGLEPSRRGLKVAKEDLLKDFARVAAELGHAPNRNEYVRHGRYAAGTMYANFRSWLGVKQAAEEVARAKTVGQLPELPKVPKLTSEKLSSRELTRMKEGPQIDADQSRSDSVASGFTTEDTEENGEEGAQAGVPVPHNSNDGIGPEIHESDKAIALRWATAVPALPGELAGKRRVTDAVCAMIVNTLMGEEAGLKWERVMMGLEPLHGENCQNCQDCQRLKIENRTFGSARNGSGSVGLARVSEGTAALARVNGSVTSGGIIDDDRPVMGPPFYPCALSNAPANEMGVMILFGMLAGELGFQIEAVQGRYPDIEAKRQIQPGKWQRVRIEAEYESRNFALHGHDPEKCDIIVCWRHNWVKCPKEIEVIELSRIVDRVIR
ncbi:MAG TPA: hypothetical protein VLN58_14255 [Verrucomicrobiae bacterium]|nr:hypothetical protein [Verrucomicrobiae bacterium]